jgi:organic hydroperoxide reductase OsmC/OhrA
VKEGIMTPLPHHYRLHLTSEPNGYATLAAPGLPDLRSAPPLAYDGPGDAWSPEHLLVAAVEACFLFTFRAVAKHAGIDCTMSDLSGEGVVSRQDGIVRFTEIVLHPKLALPPGLDMDRVRRALEKTERACLVSASLSTRIGIEPEFSIASGDPADRRAVGFAPETSAFAPIRRGELGPAAVAPNGARR